VQFSPQVVGQPGGAPVFDVPRGGVARPSQRLGQDITREEA
jgi:hypothetical protein